MASLKNFRIVYTPIYHFNIKVWTCSGKKRRNYNKEKFRIVSCNSLNDFFNGNLELQFPFNVVLFEKVLCTTVLRGSSVTVGQM